MNNITKQLANLYEPKWKELKQKLDAKERFYTCTNQKFNYKTY